MDILKWKKGILSQFGKYKYVLIIVFLGMVLMMFPTQKRDDTVVASTIREDVEEKDLATQLEQILGKIHGAGEVRVLLSVQQGEQTIYQCDTTTTEDGERKDRKEQTVLVTDADRKQAGLIYQKNPPTYLGAIILAQGADDPVVKLDIVRAVSHATGLGADRISVLKMH